jgi:NAD(P)-dependent dehydrogenase (short-subunit alcohol dehydrogenase family)
MAGRLNGRTALVTGAGGGIGRAIAMAYAAEGARVVAADIDAGSAGAVAEAISAAGGIAVGRSCDVTDAASVAALLAGITADGHGLAILVNNAGLNVRADFRHLTDADWHTIRSTNLDSIIRLSRDTFPLLQAAGSAGGSGGGAVIINVASIMAERGMRQLTAYSATKGAVKSLTRGLAVEYAAFGIRVAYIAPGFVETKLTERVLRNPAMNKALVEQTPMRRLGTPEDIAGAAVFLASDDAAYITGSGITVDGGMSAAL